MFAAVVGGDDGLLVGNTFDTLDAAISFCRNGMTGSLEWYGVARYAAVTPSAEGDDRILYEAYCDSPGKSLGEMRLLLLGFD